MRFRRPTGRELELQRIDIRSADSRGAASSSNNPEGTGKPPYWGVQVSEEVIVQ